MLTRSTRTQMDDQRKDNIDPKRHLKGTTPNNYWPITGLPMMGKVLTAQIRGKNYSSLTSRLFPKEQKWCRKGSRDTGELLYIDQYTLNESQTKRKYQAMAWIDYKKAYDMVPRSWIINCLRTYKISEEVININFIEKNMKTWRVLLTAGGKS